MKNFKSITLALMALSSVLIAQDFSAEQYKKAAWMTTRFYGAQRSGIGPNWLSIDETRTTSFVKDEVDGKDVSGGWFDCGDHVMFGQTQYYSIYALLKAFETFPTGFHDLYSGDYSGYATKAKFGYGDGTPNGIPDIIDELKYALDFVYKATGPNFFVSQKGNGDYDHQQWVAPQIMSIRKIAQGGESEGSRPIIKNPNDGAMASMASAALALGSKLLRPYYGDIYADLLAINAKYAYDYASSHPSTVSAGDFYPANASYDDNIAIAAAEMFRITGESSYLIVASKAYQLSQHGYSLNYNNENDLAVFAGGQATNDTDYYGKLLSDYVSSYASQVNGEGVATNGGTWGTLRFPVNQAFVAGLYSKATNTSNYDSFIYDQVDYVLGSNDSKQSFVVGFCEGCINSPQHPHHRGVYDNNLIPAEHKEFGALVGGSLTSNSYNDDIEDYQSTEVCTDYNVGLVASLAYILTKQSPAPLAIKIINPNGVSAKWQDGGFSLSIDKRSTPWTLKILSVKGELLYSANSFDGQFRYTPNAKGVFHAVLTNGKSLETVKIIAN